MTRLAAPWTRLGRPHQEGVSLGALGRLGALARATKGLSTLLMTSPTARCSAVPLEHLWRFNGLGVRVPWFLHGQTVAFCLFPGARGPSA